MRDVGARGAVAVMSDTWITDIRHYLDDNGFMSATMPGPARKMAEYMAAIIEAATARPAGEAWAAAAAPCRRRPGNKACPGRIIVRRTQVPAEIAWRCPKCGDNGVVSGFDGTAWDLSTSAPTSGPTIEERVTYAELGAMLDAGDVDGETRQAIVGARDTGKDAVLEVPLDELEPFVESLTAGANHAREKKQQKLIDAVHGRLTERLTSTEVRAPIDTSLDVHGVRGRWRIVEMEVWGRDYLDMEVEAFIELGTDSGGRFQFGLVQGDMHYVVVERDGHPAVEWSWVGADESDEVAGRGWAVVNGDKLEGRIFIHRGDHSAFLARRSAKTR